jgi:hypothetical protein
MNRRVLIFLGLLTLLSIMSCENDDLRSEIYQLNEFEVSAIPFEEDTNVEFINQDNIIFTATVSAKRMDIKNLYLSEDEVIMLQYIANKLEFTDSGIIYRTSIEKESGFSSNISVTSFEDNPIVYGLEDLESDDLEELLIDTASDGYTFENVFLLTSPETEEFIIYSPTKGIEFIKRANGDYLLRN